MQIMSILEQLKTESGLCGAGRCVCVLLNSAYHVESSGAARHNIIHRIHISSELQLSLNTIIIYYQLTVSSALFTHIINEITACCVCGYIIMPLIQR